MTNCATPTDYNDFFGVHINSGVNVTSIINAIRIVLDANKNY